MWLWESLQKILLQRQVKCVRSEMTGSPWFETCPCQIFWVPSCFQYVSISFSCHSTTKTANNPHQRHLPCLIYHCTYPPILRIWGRMKWTRRRNSFVRLWQRRFWRYWWLATEIDSFCKWRSCPTLVAKWLEPLQIHRWNEMKMFVINFFRTRV